MLKLRKQTLRAPSSFYTRMQSQFHLWIAALTSVGRPLFGASTAEPSRKGRGSSCRAVLSPPPPRTAVPPRPAPLQPRMGAHRTVTAPGAGPPAAPPGAGSRGGSARSLRPEAGGVQTAAPHRARLAAPGRPHPRAGTARGAGGAGVVTRGRGKWGREKTGSRGTGAAGLGPPPGPALRRAGAAPAGRPRSRPTPPPFLSSPPRVGRGGCILPRPTPRRAGPDVLPHPARPPATLLPGREARPPRCPPHSPTSWPRPCRRISPPARPGGLAAAAALGPPWPLPWWLPGWALSPSDGEERGGGPRLRTRGRCEDTSARGERSAAAASRPLTGRPLGSPRLTRRATVGASRSGAVAARSLRPLGAACSSRLSARLGASRCCRRLRLRARKATRGRSRGDCRGGEGGAAPSRSISRWRHLL